MAFPTLLATVVKNPTAAARFYSYLGAHGVTIAAGATYTHNGDLLADLSGKSSRAQKHLAAFVADLQASSPRIAIVSNPAPIEEGASGHYYALVVDGSDNPDAVAASY